MLDREEISKIKKIEGEVRGVVFKTDLKYVEKNKSKEEAENVKKEVQKIDPDFNHDKIQSMGWYPLWWRVLILLVIKDRFNWKDSDLYEMGRMAPTNSFIVKTLLTYFVSFKKTCYEAPNFWVKHYSRGNFELTEYSEIKKTVIYRISDFKVHPVLCPYLTGYFQGIAELTNKGSNIGTEEEACPFREGEYHEFVIRWK